MVSHNRFLPIPKIINFAFFYQQYCIFMCFISDVVPLPEGMECQSRPLKNLVSYLKQKDAAGVISLSNKSADQSGVLYAFPPCNFSLDLLKRVSRDLTDEGSKDDHLVVVVVKGG